MEVSPPSGHPPARSSPRHSLMKLSDTNLVDKLESIKEETGGKTSPRNNNGKSSTNVKAFFGANYTPPHSNDSLVRDGSSASTTSLIAPGKQNAGLGRVSSKASNVGPSRGDHDKQQILVSLTPPIENRRDSRLNPNSPRRSLPGDSSGGMLLPGKSSPRRSMGGDTIADAMALAVRQAQFTNQAVAGSITTNTKGNASPRNSINSGMGNRQGSRLTSSSPAGNTSPRSRLSANGTNSPAGLARSNSKRGSINGTSAEMAMYEAQQAELKAGLAAQQAEVKRLRDMARSAFKIDDIESLMMKAHDLAKKAHQVKFQHPSGEQGSENDQHERDMERIRREAEMEAERAELEWQNHEGSHSRDDMPDRGSIRGAEAATPPS